MKFFNSRQNIIATIFHIELKGTTQYVKKYLYISDSTDLQWYPSNHNYEAYFHIWLPHKKQGLHCRCTLCSRPVPTFRRPCIQCPGESMIWLFLKVFIRTVGIERLKWEKITWFVVSFSTKLLGIIGKKWKIECEGISLQSTYMVINTNWPIWYLIPHDLFLLCFAVIFVIAKFD